MVKRIFEYIFFRLSKRIGEQNFVDKDAHVAKTVYLSGCQLTGKVTIGDHCKLYKCQLSGEIVIGEHTSLWGPNLTIMASINKITIGNFCSIARNVSIQESNHRTNFLSTYHIQNNVMGNSIQNDLTSKGAIAIGHDVWIGAGAVILSGITVGTGAVIGANAVVTHDIPEFAIVGGNPARIIKYRFSPEKIAEIKSLQWWYWPIQKLKENESLFREPFA